MLMVTPWTYQALLVEIQNEKVRLREAIESRAKGVQCFKSDNFDPAYHQDSLNQRVIERRLIELESIRDMAQIVITEDQNDVLKIGNRAVIDYNGEEEIMIILEGHINYGNNSDIYAPVSIKSPVGRCIQNLKLGETAVMDLGGKKISLLIKEILSPPTN